MPRTPLALVLATTLLALLQPSAHSQEFQKPANTLRFATFNASLNRDTAGTLVRDLSTLDNVQARNVAEIIQRVRPDILLINEFDFDPDGKAIELFQKNYLGIGQNGCEPISYPHTYSAPVNTGVPSGRDLDNDGKVVSTPGGRGYGNDAIGYGQFPGQYGMVVYSRFPIDREKVVNLGSLLWKDMPGALVPKQPNGEPWYDDGDLEVLRLSSKGHWDVPVSIDGKTVHVLVSHPTPPAFDGPEDRNGKRNHDEIRLWADYLSGGPKAEYLRKALPPGTAREAPATFVLMGDQNADPVDGGSVTGAIQQLLDHPKVTATAPHSDGAVGASADQKGANSHHKGDPALDTADFSDESVGNLRVDYVLPSRDLKVVGSGIFWPKTDDPLARLVVMTPKVATSDHRLVFVDIERP